MRCDYEEHIRNLWNLPLQRLEIYSRPFQLPSGTFKVSPQASCNGPDWIGLERYFAIIEETIPFRILSPKESLLLRWRHLRGHTRSIDINACVLMDYLNSRPNYFHWFLDALPRIFAAEAYRKLTGKPFKLIVPQSLQPWQEASLRFLGVGPEQCIGLPPALLHESWGFETLISTFSHRHIRHSASGHFDAFSPQAIQTLSQRLVQGAAGLMHQNHSSSPRIYISRGNASLRQVRNEDEVIQYLARYGFEQVRPDAMPLHVQLQVFRQATHVISSHGGALTNLMHISPGCQVLEIFQADHGVRPDFFQLVALRGGQYTFAHAKSLNANNDINISLKVLGDFLEASL